MPKKLYDENGNEVEAYLKDEHEQELNTKIDEFKKANPENANIVELQNNLKKAQDDLVVAQKEIQDFKSTDKGKNMAALREKAEGSEKKVEELKDNIMRELGTLKSAIEGSKLSDAFLKLADNDAELAKKIEAEYNSIVRPEDTDEIKKQKVRKAYQLAVGTSNPSILNRVLGSSGAPNPKAGDNKQWPSELVALGQKLGLTEEDLKKRNYAPRR